jgi:DNA-binding CsgD family transcriptional regulator
MRAEHFLKLADEIDPFAATARRAFIARSSVQNHAARMHKILRGHKNVEIFGTMEAAEEWIRS